MYRTLKVRLEDGWDLACTSPAELAIHVGDWCVVQDGRTHEYGQVVELQEVADGSPATRGAMAVRRATLQDQSRARENALHGKMAMPTCMQKVAERKLPLRIIHARFSFDRTVFTATFTAEERVDFRDLVRDLSTALKAHVELKQIGVRDAAGRIGGLGPCGQTMCCCRWLRHFDAVGVKMAKQQNLALNPGTISGMCGRLKCCLRYEHDTYREMAQGLPREGAIVECEEGRAMVIDRDVLRRRLRVRLQDNRVFEYAADQVTVARDRPEPREEPAHEEKE